MKEKLVIAGEYKASPELRRLVARGNSLGMRNPDYLEVPVKLLRLDVANAQLEFKAPLLGCSQAKLTVIFARELKGRDDFNAGLQDITVTVHFP